MISIWWCVLIPGCVDLPLPKSQLSAGSKQLFDKFLWWTVSEIIVAMLIMLAMAMTRCWWWSAEKAWEEGFHTHFRFSGFQAEVWRWFQPDFSLLAADRSWRSANCWFVSTLCCRRASNWFVHFAQCALCNVQYATCSVQIANWNV